MILSIILMFDVYERDVLSQNSIAWIVSVAILVSTQLAQRAQIVEHAQSRELNGPLFTGLVPCSE